MSETLGGTVPGGDASAASAPESTSPAADQSQDFGDGGAAQSASGEPGLAPGLAADATPAVEAAPPTPSEFVFGGRRFQTQKQAEDFFRSQTGRVPEMQRKTAEQDRQIAELSSTVQALQRALSVGPQAPGREQGAARGVQSPAGAPKSFADRLVESGDLQFVTQLAEEKGLGHAIYALSELMGKEISDVREQIRNEEIEPFRRQGQFREIEGRALGVARGLGQEFPEFDHQNQSPEAVEAQQVFISNLKQFPPEFVAANPEFSMLAAALVTRHQQGIPIFAQQPGTSGSPSALAAAAAESGMDTSGPIDGSSARPRPAPPQPRTAEDQFEADIIGADDSLVRDLNGNSLGWRRSRSVGAGAR